MKHILNICIMELYGGQRWQGVDIVTVECTVADNIVFCRGEMLPGYTFNQDVVDKFCENNHVPEYGEAIYMTLNESCDRRGVYYVDAFNDEGCKPRVVEWEFTHVIADVSELGDSQYVPLVDVMEGDFDRSMVKVTVENPNLGLAIGAKGYGVSGCVDAAPILVEQYKGTLRVLVWSDINQEDPTHIISLQDAREAHRKDDSDPPQGREDMAASTGA